MTAEPQEPSTTSKGGGLIRSSMIFSGLTLVSRVFGLARDLVVAARLGASATAAADAFQTALAFPNLFRRIFAEGAFAAAFVPAYAKSLETDGEDVADKLAGDAMATLAAATIIITVICQLTMPWLMYVINAGYADDPVKFKLAVTLTQISMPYLPCMAIVAHLSGVLNARGRFVLSAIAPVILNLCMLGAMWPQKDPKMAAIAGSIGVIVAGVLQAALLAWGVRKSGAEVRWVLPKLTPEIRELLGRAVPGAISASATQLNIFISGYLASYVNGGRTWLATADRLYQLPLGLVGVAIGVALLPQLSRAVMAKDHREAQTAMDQAITFAMALTLPAAAAMASIPFFLSDALYTRGAFTVYDAHQTAHALFFYGLGVPAFVLQQLYSRAFFARGDTASPMRFALISIAVNIGAGIVFFHFFGIRGIAAATALASWINVGQSAWKLHRLGEYQPSKATWFRLTRITAASLGLAALLATASYFRPEIQAVLGRKEVAIILVAVAGAAIYPLLLFAFGGMTLSEIRGMLKRKA